MSKNVTIFLAVIAVLTLATFGFGQESIAWVGGAAWVDSTGFFNEQPYIDLLEGAGYEVTALLDTARGNPLTTEQLDLLESFDLIIVGRTTNSGDYNDPLGWNSVGKPIILGSVYLSRNSRWMWFNTADLINNGRSGAPPYRAVMPDHPIFTGVELDADNLVYPLDPEIGCGNTSLHNWNDPGDEGVVIATSVTPDSMMAVDDAIAICYWPADAGFYPDTDQFAAAPRLLFPLGTQEDSGVCPQQGEYNLTDQGDQMLLNAVAWMLGKEVGVAQDPGNVPSEFDLAQNFPNPFNPSTTIEFAIPAASSVKLSVYNMLGQQVVTLVDKVYQAGTYSATWNGLNSAGQAVESGVYLYKLETETFSSAKKMLLMK
jgi:hypothetical protein